MVEQVEQRRVGLHFRGHAAGRHHCLHRAHGLVGVDRHRTGCQRVEFHVVVLVGGERNVDVAARCKAFQQCTRRRLGARFGTRRHIHVGHRRATCGGQQAARRPVGTVPLAEQAHRVVTVRGQLSEIRGPFGPWLIVGPRRGDLRLGGWAYAMAHQHDHAFQPQPAGRNGGRRTGVRGSGGGRRGGRFMRTRTCARCQHEGACQQGRQHRMCLQHGWIPRGSWPTASCRDLARRWIQKKTAIPRDRRLPPWGR